MKPVSRDELLDLGPYEQIRERFRNRVIALKKHRRVLLGDHMSLVFENHDTVLLQVQEMLRTERISDDRSIAHELATYNELIPPAHGLCATLFIEYDDEVERRDMLSKFASLRDQLHLCVGEERITATFGTHFGEEMDRLPAINYLAFDVGAEASSRLSSGDARIALEVTHPDYPARTELGPAIVEQLAADLEN